MEKNFLFITCLALFLGACEEGEDPEAEAKKQRQRADKLERELDHAQKQVGQQRKRTEEEAQRADKLESQLDQAQEQTTQQRERTKDELQRADSATSDFSVAFTASAILATCLALLIFVVRRQQRTKRCLSQLVRWMSCRERR